MGKNKLGKFADMQTFGCVFQYPFARLEAEGFDMRGRWHEQYFHNANPIVLELGCGKGEYTVGLAERYPDKNFIGIDIKGARMWSGARVAEERGMANVAFLRTSIELLPRFFGHGEVSEIWVTFPDPQMKKVRKRLISRRFLDLYRQVAADGALIHLKTDSPFLYTFAHTLVTDNQLPVITDTDDLYASNDLVSPPLGGGSGGASTAIQTFYEQQWLARGMSIKYIAFRLPHDGAIVDPTIDIPYDTYRSFSRRTL